MDFINNINSEFKSVLDSVKEEDRLGVHSFHRLNILMLGNRQFNA